MLLQFNLVGPAMQVYVNLEQTLGVCIRCEVGVGVAEAIHRLLPLSPAPSFPPIGQLHDNVVSFARVTNIQLLRSYTHSERAHSMFRLLPAARTEYISRIRHNQVLTLSPGACREGSPAQRPLTNRTSDRTSCGTGSDGSEGGGVGRMLFSTDVGTERQWTPLRRVPRLLLPGLDPGSGGGRGKETHANPNAVHGEARAAVGRVLGLQGRSKGLGGRAAHAKQARLRTTIWVGTREQEP